MQAVDAVQTVQEIMARFAERTGLTDTGAPPRRYLWTDAFAVCNFLELRRLTGEERHERTALRLVEQVHQVLGRHREDEERAGWLSGLSEEEGRRHPTRRGLRIGKRLPERTPCQPLDERLEWDRDGQYFHYLTRWMHALARASRATGRAELARWALELGQAAHAGFTYVPRAGGTPRMYWKMSVDLYRPLVLSMGRHDPLDGWITLAQLRGAAAGGPQDPPVLDAEISELRSMCAGRDWTTDDLLGVGALLSDAYRVAQLISAGGFEQPDLLEQLLRSAAAGLATIGPERRFAGPPARRLAFRELGLSIGLRAVARTRELLERSPALLDACGAAGPLVEALEHHAPLAERIETFWLNPEHQASPSWREHLDINAVTLATSLAPDGYLTL